jgi:DNA-binding response OmpR family regulator
LSSSPTKVLVAESDEIVLALISHILHRQGYSVDVAVTAEEAANHLMQRHYRAIVVDAKLMSVVERFPDRMPCTIVLSPNADSDSRVHAVVQKPVEFGFLVDTVAACVK